MVKNKRIEDRNTHPHQPPQFYSSLTPWSVCLALSGFAALGSELLWTRSVGLLLGSTTVTQMLVLVFVMAGLSTGYGLGGWYAERQSCGRRSYLIVQSPLSFYLFFYPLLFQWLDHRLGAIPTPLIGTIAGVSIFLPSVLMGATFPLIAAPLGILHRNRDGAVGVLYGVNNLGAALGLLGTGLLVLEKWGLTGAWRFMGAMSAAAVLVAWRSAPLPHSPITSEKATIVFSPFTKSLLRSVFIFSFCAMVYEIVYLRTFALLLGSFTYGFTLIVTSFILGIALGSFWAQGRATDLAGLKRALARSQSWATISALLFPALAWLLPKIFLSFASSIGRDAGSYALYQALCFGLGSIAVLPVALACGAVLPLASRMVAISSQQSSRLFGALMAVGATGSLAGTVLAGLWGLPLLGLGGAIVATAFLHELATSSVTDRRLTSARSISFVIGALVSGWAVAHPAYRAGLDQGPYRLPAMETNPVEALRGLVQSQVVRSTRDGAHGTVSVIESPEGDRILYVDGKPDASLQGDLPTQYLLADLPLLLTSSSSPRVLVIGYGSGATSGRALRYNAEVDTVEISKEVIGASTWFELINGKPLENPKHHLYLGDAKSFLRKPGPPYDVIISEPSNPWMSAIASLFTEDQFRAARARLRPGGLMVQWFHLYQMTDAIFLNVVRTFASVFPHVRIWNTQGNDVVLIGSDQPIEPSFNDMESRFARPTIREPLGTVGLKHLSSILRLERAATPALTPLVGPGPVYTDEHPRLEFETARACFAMDFSRVLWAWAFSSSPQRQPFLLLARFQKERRQGFSLEELQESADYLARWFDRPSEPLYVSLLQEIVSRFPKESAHARRALGQLGERTP